MRGDRISDFIYVPIHVTRAPITLSVSAEGSIGARNVSVPVQDPKLSTVRAAMSTLVNGALRNITLPARFEFTSKEINSLDEVNSFLGAKASFLKNKIETSLSSRRKQKKHEYTARYRQIYYTVDVDTPEQGAVQLVAPMVTPADLRQSMPQGALPVYVSSVSYGMMAVLYIESDSSEDEVEMALKAHAEKGKGKLDAEAKEKTGLPLVAIPGIS